VGDDSHFMFRQKLLGEDGIVRRGVVMLKQPGLFSPKVEVMSRNPQFGLFGTVLRATTTAV
jgi:hypothetical protein